ncbi:response regulator transcription factor [Flavobacterium zepuense]|uniref:Response regulator transcription factor n=1 Tax=Flavobacterium zepuense TaxID=2593302 RepID=A0A552V4E7_9FLAO|nr:response regulator transcription factor [Flavobacterium zepuense]TRW25343.1 response regulator transcription factor [Flavobacterium zepuense]
MIQIAITDDHTIVIEGIKTLLRAEKDICISKSFTTINDLLAGLDESTQVLLLDINLPDGSGIDACKVLLKKFPELKIIALTNFDETSFIKQMMKNGAMGYLLKNTGKPELILAIKTVMEGKRYLSASITTILLNESLGEASDASFIPKLTSREQEILNLIIKEYTTEEIANAIFLSTKTVESHRSNLFQKLGVKNSAGLVRVAFEKGLV